MLNRVTDSRGKIALGQYPAGTSKAPSNTPEPPPTVVEKPQARTYSELPKVGQMAVDAVYVHVPFCSSKCHYCDFYSVAGHLDQADAYLEALAEEVRLTVGHFGRESLGKVETIFVGGGTPTLMDAGKLERLMGIVRGAVGSSEVVEFTVEANPNTFDAARAEVLAAAGVNRISFGAQSFVASELAMLQRDHDPESVAAAFATARAAGITNLNTDLIFGIPGQTLATWEYSLSQALGLGASHLSCYSLTYEPNTVMTARMKRGEVVPIDEELELGMFEHVYGRMRGAGFERYEVSNYAVPGKECRHNVHYWKGGNWLGFGPSGASHVGGWRWKNVAGLGHYVGALVGDGQTDDGARAGRPRDCGRDARITLVPGTQMEHLEAGRRAGEIAIFWLRLVEGLDYAEFRERVGMEARGPLERVLGKYVGMGLVELSAERARVTEAGVVVSDRILRDVVDAWED